MFYLLPSDCLVCEIDPAFYLISKSFLRSSNLSNLASRKCSLNSLASSAYSLIATLNFASISAIYFSFSFCPFFICSSILSKIKFIFVICLFYFLAAGVGLFSTLGLIICLLSGSEVRLIPFFAQFYRNKVSFSCRK